MNLPSDARRDGRRRERGQTMVLMALAMVVLIGMVGLVVDGSFAYIHRRQMQNAADAGAHDGTAVLARNYKSVCAFEAAARKAAVDGALANGVVKKESVTVGMVDINGNPTTPCNPTTTMGVSVGVGQPYTTYFAGVLGITQMAAGADATAHYGFINALIGALPIVLNLDSVPANVNDGKEHDAKLGTSGGGPPGYDVNFGSIDPMAYGQTLADSLANGLTIKVTSGLGCGTPAKPCTAGSITAFDRLAISALQNRIDSAPLETWNNHAQGSRRVATMLVLNGDIGGKTVIPTGFALVFIDKVLRNGLEVHFISGSIVAAGAQIDYTRNNANAAAGTPTLIQLIR